LPALSIAVIGGGIGGASAALSLLKAGFDVHVYEQARELREVGAGVQISPNASRVLHGLGLADRLAGMGVKPLAWHQRRWDDGRTLLRTPLADAMEAAFGSPHYQMHRADVLEALVDAIPPERIHVAHALVGFADRGDRVEAEFQNGARIAADVLVGADGIHSAVRRILIGPEQPHFTGCMCYRGLVPAEAITHLDIPVEAQIWMGPGGHFVHYYVRNKELLNFVAVVERDTWTSESWADRGDIREARAAYDKWHAQVRGILEAVDETFIWALFDRTPMKRWSVGRVTLLGDACHAMLPFMAQGAAQAIEDGATLAACLQTDRDVPDALRLYEALRLPRTARVQTMAANNKVRFHLPDGGEQAARDAEMAKNVTDWSLKNVAWLYGHDATRLDAPAV
jgi:2-polyprenyl-6-methoxyphenol hydroxylase-like FAD-dependent oxidoreductase